MTHLSYQFRVERKKTSYQFKVDMASPDSWEDDHNAQNNAEDFAQLVDPSGQVIWSGFMQTVANMPGARHTDTIRSGRFYVKWDVDRRAFKGHVHGIVGATDFDDQVIDENSVETIPGKNGAPVDWARWIFGHSTLKNDPATEGVTRFAWSAGCFIHATPEKQAELYEVGLTAGFKAGDLVPILVIDV